MGSGKSTLKEWATPIDSNKFTGKWFVNAVIPTPFEKNVCNPTETYTMKKGKNNVIEVLFEYNKGSINGKKKALKQILHINNKDGNWSISPSFLPFVKLSFTVLEIGGDYQDGDTERYNYVVIAHKQKFAWIMSRASEMETNQMEKLLKLLTDNGFKDLEKKVVYPEHNSS